MKIQIDHTTKFTFENPTSFGLQRLLMRPKSDPSQTILDWNVTLTQAETQLIYTDHFGNEAELIKSDIGNEAVEIRVSGTVETHNSTGVYGHNKPVLPLWIFMAETPLTQLTKTLKSVVGKLDAPRAEVSYFHDLSDQIRTQVPYTLDATTPSTSAGEAWDLQKGVCQDHAHIMITLARDLGFPARYVSGYLLMNDRVNQTAMHAWCEIYFGDIGWVGFDVSNGYSPDERYVRIAIGRDYQDAQPSRGIRYGSGAESLEVSLQIQQ